MEQVPPTLGEMQALLPQYEFFALIGRGGTDADWQAFSVQWDGFIEVTRPLKIATRSDDASDRARICLRSRIRFPCSVPARTCS
jgi:hypothetical protein